MVIFDEKELEISIVTFNRANYVEEWLDLCYNELIKRNIHISIYDSSTNNETENLINNRYKESIEYVRVDSNIPIGYKPMLPILNTKCKYIWVSGDSRYHNFEELDKTIFQSIKKQLDFILISAGYHNECNNTIFNNKAKFLNKCFISLTCIGLSIYRVNMFDRIKNNKELLNELDIKYKNNYGFGWIGYFLESFINHNQKAIYHAIVINDVIKKRKFQHWTKRYYECWVENLCNLVDNIPECYDNKYYIPRIVWDEMKLYSISNCYIAKVNGGLNKEIFHKYYDNGMLNRVTNKIIRIWFFAMMPLPIVSIMLFINKVYYKFLKLIKVHCK